VLQRGSGASQLGAISKPHFWGVLEAEQEFGITTEVAVFGRILRIRAIGYYLFGYTFGSIIFLSKHLQSSACYVPFKDSGSA